MLKSHMKLYANTITAALASRRQALQLELAVTFAVLQESDLNKRLAKEAMCQIYSQVGYACATPSDRDWKSVNRHINAAFALFDFIGASEVSEWGSGLSKGPLIDAIVAKLVPLKLSTVNEVLTVTEKVRPPAKRGLHVVADGGRVLTTKHMNISVPKNVTRSELVDAALQMMKLAEEMFEGEQASHAQDRAA